MIAGRNSDRDGELEKYMVKLGHKSYKCSACDSTFSFSSNLRAHVESKHYSPGYTCSYCNKEFKIRKVYTQHLRKCGVVLTWPQIQEGHSTFGQMPLEWAWLQSVTDHAHHLQKGQFLSKAKIKNIHTDQIPYLPYFRELVSEETILF